MAKLYECNCNLMNSLNCLVTSLDMRTFNRFFKDSLKDKLKRSSANITNSCCRACSPTFSAKLIGSMYVSKPTDGYEIMATVRQTRVS
ncbi:hypothetical protein GJ496_011291 [Pomphorhynchus laevis]|nr:hypothetical protein GJ496_011291 [Pomphorhynchus laevis]